MTTTATKATVWEGSAPVNLARITGYDGNYLTQAVTSVSYRVDSRDADGFFTEVVAATVLDKTVVLFNSLQTGGIWMTGGGNFKHQLSADDIPDGDTTYVVQYTITDSNGDPFYFEFELKTKEQRFT